MNIAILDGVVIAVVFLSAILAMFRGFVREVLSIAALRNDVVHRNVGHLVQTAAPTAANSH